jgi:proteasome lid subunit RPN8/RPN11
MMSKVTEQSVVYIAPKVNSRIMEYAQAATGEISGFGCINPHTGIVDKLFPLMNQVCSGTETEINPDMITEFVKSGQSSKANVWWHSHVNMGAFWSGTDDTCIETLGQTMTSLLSIVVNKKREYKARFDLFRPIRVTIDVQLCFHYEFPYEEIERIRAEVKDKVKARVYTPVVHQSKQEKREKRLIQNGMSEFELNLYGYKVVNGNQISQMSQQEIVAFRLKYPHLTKEIKNNASFAKSPAVPDSPTKPIRGTEELPFGTEVGDDTPGFGFGDRVD